MTVEHKWVVADMDEGIVHQADTRKACVDWILSSGGEVLSRYKYGPGNYEYITGYPGEDDADNHFVLLAAKATAAGFEAVAEKERS